MCLFPKCPLLASMAPEQIAMEMGGWSDIGTMRKIYTHIAQQDMERYKTKLQDFFKNAN